MSGAGPSLTRNANLWTKLPEQLAVSFEKIVMLVFLLSYYSSYAIYHTHSPEKFNRTTSFLWGSRLKFIKICKIFINLKCFFLWFICSDMMASGNIAFRVIFISIISVGSFFHSQYLPLYCICIVLYAIQFYRP